MNYSLGNNFFRNGIDFFERNNKDFNYMRTDIYEKEEAYYLKIETPGIDKSNIGVNYDNGYLTVTVKQDETVEETNDYIRKERITSEMQRSFYVGDVNEDSIKATHENGILTIRLDKKEENSHQKQITIE